MKPHAGSWWRFALWHPFRYAIVLGCIVLSIVPSLAITTLIGYAFSQFNAKPELITWIDFLGEHRERWVRPFVRNTAFVEGIPAEFHTQWFPWFLLATGLLMFILRGTQEYLLEYLGEKVSMRLRHATALRFMTLSYAEAQRLPEGFIAQLISDDLREVRLAFVRITGGIPADLFNALLYTTLLCLLDTQLFLIFIAVLLPAGVVIRITGKKLKRLSREGLSFQSELLGALLEKLRGWQTIRVYRAGGFEIGKFSALNDRLFHVWRRSARAKALGSPLVEWLAMIAASFVIIAALRRVADDSISGPVLVSFLAVLALLANSLQTLTSQLNSIKKGQEALKRVRNFLGLTAVPLEKRGDTPITELSLKNLEIHTSGSQVGHETSRCLLKNFSLELRRGDVVAIMGPSGCGKSTLLRVILGLESPTQGTVVLNGTPGQAWGQCGEHIAFVAQDPFIITGSVYENILYPKLPGSGESKMREQARDVLSLVNLDKSLDASVIGLSGGEKQRLALARALFHRPHLLIIDEGTSALDLANERQLLERLQSTQGERITILVAHRSAVRQFATALVEFPL